MQTIKKNSEIKEAFKRLEELRTIKAKAIKTGKSALALFCHKQILLIKKINISKVEAQSHHNKKSFFCTSVLQEMDSNKSYHEALNKILKRYPLLNRKDLENELKSYI